MRTILLATTLLTFFGLGACADHSGSMVALEAPSAPPINPPDDNNLTPNQVNEKPEAPTEPGTGNNPGGGGGFEPGGGGGSGSGNEPGGAGAGGGNPPGGSPVPEPGTMLLVGTGLAGAAFLRRRRRTQVEQDR